MKKVILSPLLQNVPTFFRKMTQESPVRALRARKLTLLQEGRGGGAFFLRRFAPTLGQRCLCRSEMQSGGAETCKNATRISLKYVFLQRFNVQNISLQNKILFAKKQYFFLRKEYCKEIARKTEILHSSRGKMRKNRARSARKNFSGVFLRGKIGGKLPKSETSTPKNPKCPGRRPIWGGGV